VRQLSPLPPCLLQAPGYGYGLIVSVIIDGMLLNSSAPLILSYAAPQITTVSINNTVGLTTAGSADGAIVITGNNFG